MHLSCTADLASVYCCESSIQPLLSILISRKYFSTYWTEHYQSPTYLMASSITKETTETSVQLYNRSLFDKQLRDSWKSLYDILLLPLLYTTLLFWACLCLYWGSTVSNDLSRIPVAVVNLDNGDFGRDLVQSVSSFSGHLNNTLDWNFDHSVSSEEQATELLLREKVWAVVQGTIPLHVQPLQAVQRY